MKLRIAQASVATFSALLTVVTLTAGGPATSSGEAAPVTFNGDVAPIVFEHCAGCHRPGGPAPFSLLAYPEVKQRASLIAKVTADRIMPPWQPDAAAADLHGDRRLSPAQIEVFHQWAEAGAPEGDVARKPTPPVFAGDWELGAPDIVVSMAEPFIVPAGGADVFRNFVLEVPLADRRYVRAMEFRPGNARVLHHARILLDDTGEVRRRDGKDAEPGFAGMDAPGARFPDGHFLGWAPGKHAREETHPWPLEPGTDLVVQMHLTPSGRAEVVQAAIGLYLTDRAPAGVPLMLRLGSKTIDIAAGTAAYEVADTFVLPVDVTALSISPHAHYLAREMTITAERPDGRIQTLLHIPAWNFNWQDDYAYRTPVPLPRGTRIAMRYVYDNSEANPRNPSSPPKRVRFGPDTRDEMGELLLQVLPDRPADVAALRSEASRKNLAVDLAGEEKRVRDVPGDFETRNALGVAYVQLGRVDEALDQFEEALRLAPGHAVAHYNLGVIAMGQGRRDAAIASFERALAAEPDYVEAHNNLGIALELAGRGEEAVPHYVAALVSQPAHAAAHNNLGRLLLARGRTPEALEHFRAALRTRPDSPDLLLNLGRGLVASGDSRQAVQQWRKALLIRPDSLAVLLELSRALTADREVSSPREAVEMAERANRIAGGTAVSLDVLAAAYAADRRFDAAIETARAALERALGAKDAAMADHVRRRLDVYQRKQSNDASGSGIP